MNKKTLATKISENAIKSEMEAFNKSIECLATSNFEVFKDHYVDNEHECYVEIPIKLPYVEKNEDFYKKISLMEFVIKNMYDYKDVHVEIRETELKTSILAMVYLYF